MTPLTATAVSLAVGDLAVSVAAGSFLEVRSLTHRGTELLVGPDELPRSATVHGQAAGITLLHPWANRIGRNGYTLAGRRAVLLGSDGAIDRDAGGAAIHGLAAPPRAWRLQQRDEACAVAEIRHDPADGSPFPFAHRIDVELALRLGRLEISTTLTATGDHPVPVAFGWHPYLRLLDEPRARWRLAMPARRHLTADEHGLPTGASRDEPATEERLAARALDDIYDRLAPGASFALRSGARRIKVQLLDGYPAAQVYAPTAVDVVSIEPMTCATNALITRRGLSFAAPGASYRATFGVSVSEYPGRR